MSAKEIRSAFGATVPTELPDADQTPTTFVLKEEPKGDPEIEALISSNQIVTPQIEPAGMCNIGYEQRRSVAFTMFGDLGDHFPNELTCLPTFDKAGNVPSVECITASTAAFKDAIEILCRRIDDNPKLTKPEGGPTGGTEPG